MNQANLETLIPKGSDCTDIFRSAYENRYTWNEEFSGYKGLFLYTNSDGHFEGSFVLGKDLEVDLPPGKYNCSL